MTGLGRWVRADWRQRWKALVVLTLVAGVAFAVVLTAFAGARRTASSFDRLRAATRAYDHFVVVYSPFPGDPVYSPNVVRNIEHLPAVASYGGVTFYTVWPVGNPDVNIQLGAPSDEVVGSDIDRPRLVRGRMFNPGSTNEVIINEAAVRKLHVDVGGTIDVMSLTPKQLGAADFSAFRGPRLRFHVVGVNRDVSDVEGEPATTIIATPAFDRAERSRVAAFGRALFIRRRADASATQFQRELERAEPSHPLGDTDAAVEAEPARKAVTALTNGLSVFACVAAVVALVAIGQAVARHVSGAGTDEAVLEALGTTRRARVLAYVTTVAPVVLGATVLAVVGSIAASPLMPVGIARQIEPRPGVRIDPLVLLLGALGVLVALVTVAVITAARSTRAVRVTRAESRRARGAGVAPGVARGTRLPPVADLGTRFAFDRRPPALPVRSAFAGVSIAVIGLVGCITFSATLNRFVTSPPRWGYGWDLNAPGNRETALDAHSLGAPDALADARRVARTPGVAAAAVLADSFTSYRGTNGTLAWGLAPVAGRVGYALRSGRQPVGPDEMVVGPETAKHFHFHIGSEVPVDNVTGHRNLVRVVGVALFPPLDSGTFNDSVGFSAAGFARHVEPDGVTRRVAVRLSPHADRAGVARELTRIVGSGRVAAAPTRPGDVDNVASLRRFPGALALFVGLLGLGALAHIVFSTGRRRRRELATLRSIGFTRGQTGGCLVWQSLTVTIAALVIGVPLGIVVGDRVWQAATDSLGTATDALYPALAILLVAAAACALAVAVGAPVGWRVTRTRPARVLHGE